MGITEANTPSSEPPPFGEPDLERLARAWQRIDPNPDHRDAIGLALDAGSDAVAALFGTPLSFGTAGLRGRVGPGPGAMNQVVVRTVAHALGQAVSDRGGSHVVIGYDARNQSDVFAHDTARVIAGLGLRATLIDEPRPTPLLAFAVRDLGADAGVMVTASHNPRDDNGYKVYGADGALLTAPADTELASLMAATPLVADRDLADDADERIVRASADLIERYVAAVGSLLQGDGARSARTAYTPLHGVGHDLMQRAFVHAGFDAPIVVAEQAEPDGDFPTTAFPNPEEPGALDLLIATATEARADLAIANDPDADRLAVAVPTGESWRLLSGDELGCILAEHLLATGSASDGDGVVTNERLVLNTVVSSRLLGEVAKHHGVRHAQTLTGFKWIMHAQAAQPDARFVFGYEEALGYAVGTAVRDKDGISSALVVAELASALADQDKTLLDALDDLHRRHGPHLSGQRSVRFEDGGPTSAEVMTWLRASPPRAIGANVVTRVVDLLADGGPLPPTDALALELEGGRVTIRPSGTEPKLKLYAEFWRAPTDDLGPAREATHRDLHATLNALGAIVCDPERAATAMRLPTREAADERAARLFEQAPQSINREQALRLVIEAVDLTTLAGDDTAGRVRALCAQARRPDPADPTVGPTAAVCVYPNLVSVAAELNRGSGIAVASVAGAFPSGLSSLENRLADIDDAVRAGADEIDVVLNRSAFWAHDDDRVVQDLQAMRSRIGTKAMKVIIETSELGSAAAIARAAELAIRGGADWIKTSTGKSGAGATPVGVLTMAEVIAEHSTREPDRPIGLKISGGVRTSAEALGFLAILEDVLGADWLHPDRVRFGASSLLNAVVDDLAATRSR